MVMSEGIGYGETNPAIGRSHRMTTTRLVTVGKTTDIKPGELMVFDVDGVRIAVANADGRFFAIDDTCTHEQCSLAADGTLEGTVVTCGCHGAQFDVTSGAVLAPPAPEPVKSYPLRVDQGELVVEV
jgi:3-phenylpropionate/trans-cinnamate dioxygenase ferredoxin subunit